MKEHAILFRLVWSDRILTQEEKDELLRKDTGAGIFMHPIDTSEKYFKYDGSDLLYSLTQIQTVIKDDPGAIWTAHEVKYRKNDPYSIRQLGEMEGRTAIQKFG